MHLLKQNFRAIEWKNITLLILLLFHIIFTNAYYDNWSSLSKFFLRGDVYSSYCTADEQKGLPLPDGRCDKQRLYVSKLLPITRFIHCAFSCIAGSMLEKFGPFITASIGLTAAILSWILIGLWVNVHWCIIASCVFRAVSVDTSGFPVLMIRQKFPNCRNMIMSIIGAFSSLSSSVPIILNLILDDTRVTFTGLSLTYAFLILGITWIAVSIIFLRFLDGKDSEIAVVDAVSISNRISLWDCLVSTKFVCIASFFFCVNITMTFHQYFINFSFDSDSPTVKILEISFVASFLPCIALGAYVERYGITIILLILNSVGLVVPILSLYPCNATGIAMSLCIMLIYSLYITSIFCYVQLVFPAYNFGIIVGIISTVGGCGSILCIFIIDLCQTEDYIFNVNITMVFLRLFAFVPLIYIHKARFSEKINSQTTA